MSISNLNMSCHVAAVGVPTGNIQVSYKQGWDDKGDGGLTKYAYNAYAIRVFGA